MSAPIRLEREMPAARQAGCATAIGVVLAAVGSVMTFALRSNPPQGRNGWVLYAVGGGFAIVGLLMVILGIKMFVANRLPETIVEVDGGAFGGGRLRSPLRG